MDFRFNRAFCIHFTGILVRLLIALYLVIPIVLSLLHFELSIIYGKLLIEIATLIEVFETIGELSAINYTIILVLVSLIPLSIITLWQRTNKLMLFLCVSLLILHVISLEFSTFMPYLFINQMNYVLAPSVLILISLITVNITHFLHPNQYTRPYLSLLPYFLLLTLYFDFVSPALVAMVTIFSDVSTLSTPKTDAKAFFFYSFESLPSALIVVYLFPFCSYLLARYWQPLIDSLLGFLGHLIQRKNNA